MPASISATELQGDEPRLPPEMMLPVFVVTAVVIFFAVCILVWEYWHHLRKPAFRLLSVSSSVACEIQREAY